MASKKSVQLRWIAAALVTISVSAQAGNQKARPDTIRYSQDSISPTFTEGKQKGQSIQVLIDALINAKDQAEVTAMKIPPIVVCDHKFEDGVTTSVTLDNRRLYAFRKANAARIKLNKKVLMIPINSKDKRRCGQELEENKKLTTKTNGTKIKVDGTDSYDSEGESSSSSAVSESD